MKTPNTIEDNLDKIRLEIYETIKNMSHDEILSYYQKKTDEAVKKYGLKLVTCLPKMRIQS
ncbi:MAG: hypothetical protein LBS33_05730 [Streptococcaceae bacterium]|jgi:hypothetical protein|nr:hypothetical protein [Streptococcaceae bacterium]